MMQRYPVIPLYGGITTEQANDACHQWCRENGKTLEIDVRIGHDGEGDQQIVFVAPISKA